MSDYKFTDGMREISGFGGSYEQACRQMVISGAEWLDEHPDKTPEWSQLKGVTGLVRSENDPAERLIDTMVEAAGEDPTGAMVHACVSHVAYIDKHGWESFVEKMEEENER